ncbi:MAG: hypothetical protein HY329_18150 [Chloroflexi bacterium]|nr:hypothetical protein [Chloroflexota bacterium]
MPSNHRPGFHTDDIANANRWRELRKVVLDVNAYRQQAVAKYLAARRTADRRAALDEMMSFDRAFLKAEQQLLELEEKLWPKVAGLRTG